MLQQPVHIPVSVLWEYSKGHRALESEHLHHLASCQDCVAVLWLGRSSDSIEHLKTRLIEHNIANE